MFPPGRLDGLARPLGRVAFAVFVLVALVAIMLSIANDGVSLEIALQLLAFGAFAIVGTILLEQAAHPIGWICIAIGLGGVLSGFTSEYADFARAHELGGLQASSALALFVAFPATAMVFTFLPLLFPDGHLPSPRWRWVAWIAVADIGMFILVGLTPAGLFNAGSNPIAILPDGPLAQAAQAAVGPLTILTGALCASALLVRYEQAPPEVRQQLKWVATAVAVFAASLVLSILLPPLDTFAWVMPIIPISVGIAVLRYRLYDIDVIISRALVYIPLTALLGGLYAASVALFQRLFVSVTGETSDAAIVITTLILAGAFTPARRALEGAVERRFKPSAVATSRPEGRLVAIDDAAFEARLAAIVRTQVRDELEARAADRPEPQEPT